LGKRILITGGAGFIGSHVADELLRHGYAVRALDSLEPQVHGAEGVRPAYLDPEVELHVGDVCDPAALVRALDGVDAVIHLAAAVGVGQSMYRIAHYTWANNLGTATLLEALLERRPERLVVASSMSVYGEGLYRDADGATVSGAARRPEDLAAGRWEVYDAAGRPLSPIPTPETKPPALASVYALSKYDQERMALIVGGAYGVPTVALRLFNVYGPRQALSNPYTGVLAIFSSRLLNGQPPLVYEDGAQLRDLVSVYDVARAFRLALESPAAPGEVLNIGSGRHYSIREVAERMAQAMGKGHIAPEITGKYRVGDVRHCYADISRAQDLLGYRPEVFLDEHLGEMAAWLEAQTADDRAPEALRELEVHRLTR
jgi:dTDP-L-rhamnose 4-epimerase